MYYSEAQARELVARAGHMLQERGLVARTWGNISARISETRFVITPSGLAYEDLRPEQLALYDLSDGSWQGPCKPSSEKGIHADAYRLRSDISFVIHTHQDMASICGIKGEALDLAGAVPAGPVPCAAYGLPSTKKLRQAVAKALKLNPQTQTVLLRRHGVLCVGGDMEEAFSLAAKLELTEGGSLANIARAEEAAGIGGRAFLPLYCKMCPGKNPIEKSEEKFGKIEG